MARRTLVLEDSRTQAKIICKMFERAGFSPLWVSTADEAKKALRAEAFDLLVLDVFIDRQNVLDDLGSLKELAGKALIAVMTAGRIDNPDAGADALNKARRGRAAFLLPKPFYFDDVKQITEDVEAYWQSQADNSHAIAS